ncbi:MAG: hypothetical protein V4469_02420 [Patescibacteria group bacterium]
MERNLHNHANEEVYSMELYKSRLVYTITSCVEEVRGQMGYTKNQRHVEDGRAFRGVYDKETLALIDDCLKGFESAVRYIERESNRDALGKKAEFIVSSIDVLKSNIANIYSGIDDMNTFNIEDELGVPSAKKWENISMATYDAGLGTRESEMKIYKIRLANLCENLHRLFPSEDQD